MTDPRPCQRIKAFIMKRKAGKYSRTELPGCSTTQVPFKQEITKHSKDVLDGDCRPQMSGYRSDPTSKTTWMKQAKQTIVLSVKALETSTDATWSKPMLLHLDLPDVPTLIPTMLLHFVANTTRNPGLHRPLRTKIKANLGVAAIGAWDTVGVVARKVESLP